MRPRIIIAIVVAAIVVIGGFVWYGNQTEQARLEDEQAAQIAREQEEELAREEEAAETGQAARDAENAEAAADAGTEADDTTASDDGNTVVGDEITEDTIVVDSASEAPPILSPEDTTNTARNGDDAESGETPSAPDTEAQAEDSDGAMTDDGAANATATDAEQLLMPENFDRDEVLALLDDSAQLTDETRSTLVALVEGASTNPDMVEAAIESVRDALGLSLLN